MLTTFQGKLVSGAYPGNAAPPVGGPQIVTMRGSLPPPDGASGYTVDISSAVDTSLFNVIRSIEISTLEYPYGLFVRFPDTGATVFCPPFSRIATEAATKGVKAEVFSQFNPASDLLPQATGNFSIRFFNVSVKNLALSPLYQAGHGDTFYARRLANSLPLSSCNSTIGSGGTTPLYTGPSGTYAYMTEFDIYGLFYNTNSSIEEAAIGLDVIGGSTGSLYKLEIFVPANISAGSPLFIKLASMRNLQLFSSNNGFVLTTYNLIGSTQVWITASCGSSAYPDAFG